jgi:hypothetical protein
MLYGFHGISSIEKKTHLIWQVNFMHHISSPISYILMRYIPWKSLHYNHIHSLTFIHFHSLYYKKWQCFLEQYVYNVVYHKILVRMHTHTIWPSVVIPMMTTIVCLCMYVCFSSFALSCHGFLSIWSSIYRITSHVQCNSSSKNPSFF